MVGREGFKTWSTKTSPFRLSLLRSPTNQLIMSVDQICREEAFELVKRSPKYWLMVLSFYLKGIGNALPAKVFRAGYFFARHIDDVLDGDRPSITSDPKTYVESIVESMDASEGGPEIVELYRFTVKHLAAMVHADESPEAYFKRVIKDAMLFDYERAQERRILSSEELEQYYEDTFEPVMDIALIGTGSSMRCTDIPEAIWTQGHLYSIRDLSDDLSAGIINIPREVLEESSIDTSKPFSAEDAYADPVISKWVEDEIALAKTKLQDWLEKLEDEGARTVCLLLIRQLQVFCMIYEWKSQMRS